MIQEPGAGAVERRLARERHARRESENIAERATTELYEAVRALQESKAVLDETTDFVAIAEPDGQARYLNRAMLELLGIEASATSQINVFALLSPASRERVEREAMPTLQDKGLWRGELAIVPTGSRTELAVSQVLIGHREDGGRIDSISSISRDITERLAMEQQLSQLALHDALTGLANRRLLFDRLDVARARAARGGKPIGVFFVDLDDFKRVNDTHGHEAGDDVLSTVGARLAACVRPADTVARLGGDEFAVLCEHVGDEGGGQLVAERLAAALSQPIEVGDGTEVVVTASIGVVVTSCGEEGPEGLLRQADRAMYEAKRAGKAGIRQYLPGLDAGDGEGDA